MPSVPGAVSVIIWLLFVVLYAWLVSSARALELINEQKLEAEENKDETETRRLLHFCHIARQAQAALNAASILCTLICGAMTVATMQERFVRIVFADQKSTALQILSMIILLIITCTCMLLFAAVPVHHAERNPEKTLLRRYGLLNTMLALAKPYMWITNKLSRLLLRVFGIDPDEATEQITEDEILAMVDIGEESGTIEPEEKELIENIFEFSDQSAEDVMTHRMDVEAIWIGDDDKTILHTILNSGLSRFPVYDQSIDDVIGILSTRDYLLESHRPSPRPLKAILREAFFVPGTIEAGDLFRQMQQRKQHMAIVTDEYGGMNGIVTMEDLLEEIVGNIYDEFDPQAEAQITRLDQNLWRISGSASLSDVDDNLGIQIPEDEHYDTLAGLIFSQLDRIPDDGTTPEVNVFGLNIRVQKLQEHRIESALVSKADSQMQNADETEPDGQAESEE